MQKPKRLAIVGLSLGLFTSSVALAETERKSPLADSPAVRSRVELRSNRFEVGAGIGFGLAQAYYNPLMVGAKVGYHLSDWLTIRASGMFNLPIDWKTGLHNDLVDSLPPTDPKDGRTPSKSTAVGGLSKIGQVFGVHGEIVPFTGKYSLFSRIFMNYDFYALGGFGAINYASGTCQPPPTDTKLAPQSCAVSGMRPGFNWGVGMRSYFNQYMGLGIELQDIFARENPGGRDTNGDIRKVTESNDEYWAHNFFLAINFTLMLPTVPKISD